MTVGWRGLLNRLRLVAWAVFIAYAYYVFIGLPPLADPQHPVLLFWRWSGIVVGPVAFFIYWFRDKWRRQFDPRFEVPRWKENSPQLRRMKRANILLGKSVLMLLICIMVLAGTRYHMLVRPFGSWFFAVFLWCGEVNSLIHERELVASTPSSIIRGSLQPLRSEHWGEARRLEF
jgi:hypothetical protein